MPLVTVQLGTEYQTGDRQHLAAIGDVPELGAWVPARAKHCHRHGNIHTVDIGLPNEVAFEFKWILLDDDDNVIQWQDGENRRVEIPPEITTIAVYAPWDAPDVLVQEGTETYSNTSFFGRMFGCLKKFHWMTIMTLGVSAIALLAAFKFNIVGSPGFAR